MFNLVLNSAFLYNIFKLIEVRIVYTNRNRTTEHFSSHTHHVIYKNAETSAIPDIQVSSVNSGSRYSA